MKVEKRRYRISSFREIPGTDDVRVILESAPIVPKPTKKRDFLKEAVMNPQELANEMMQQQLNKMIHDTFLISQEEYQRQKYMVGDFVIVSIEKE